MKRARKETGGAGNKTKKTKHTNGPAATASVSATTSLPRTATSIPGAPAFVAPSAGDLNFWSTSWDQLSLPSIAATLVNLNNYFGPPLLPALPDVVFPSLPEPPHKRPRLTPPNEMTMPLPPSALFEASTPATSTSRILMADQQRAILMSLHSSQSPEEFLHLIRKEDRAGYNVDVVLDNDGNKPAHWAAYFGKADILHSLVRYGADMAAFNNNGETPLMRAIQGTSCYGKRTFNDVLKILKDTMTARDCDGRTALHHAALAAGVPARSPAAEYYLQCLSDIDEEHYIMEDEDLDAQDRWGDTAIHLLCRARNKGALEILLEMGCGPDLRNHDGLLPRDVAAGDRSLVRRLASKVHVEQTDSEDDSDLEDGFEVSDSWRGGSAQNLHGRSNSARRSRQPTPEMSLPTLPPSPSPSIHSLSDFLPSEEIEAYPALHAIRDKFKNQLLDCDDTVQTARSRLREARELLTDAIEQNRGFERDRERLGELRRELLSLEAKASEDMGNESGKRESDDAEPPHVNGVNGVNGINGTDDGDAETETGPENLMESLRAQVVDLTRRIGRIDQNQTQIAREIEELKKEGGGGRLDGYRSLMAWCCSVPVGDVQGILDDLDEVVGSG
ncbi:transcriptional regulator swi6 [Rhizophlyctis rosea]|nr:transcriptional regulator swi6 [Rhizophlyctis rosea]